MIFGTPFVSISIFLYFTGYCFLIFRFSYPSVQARVAKLQEKLAAANMP